MQTLERPAVLTEQYPEIAPHVEQLPEHVVDQLGEIAVQLTHEDMHPKNETEGQYGDTVRKIDFDSRITDAEFDKGQLETEAIEAAEQGKQKLADVLTGSAKLLGEAHTELTEQGVEFGGEILETDEARDKREATERDEIYEKALQSAIKIATEAKSNGNQPAAVEAIESLLLLRYVQQGERQWGEKDRSALRSLVRAGLTDELVQGAQTANKLFIGTDYENVSSSLYDAKLLLECATGKHIESKLTPTSTIEQYHFQTVSVEDIKDIMAVMTTDGAALTPEQGFEAMQYSTVMNAIKAKVNPSAARGEIGSLSYFDAFLEKSDTTENINKALEFENPMLCLEVMEKLGISDAWRIEPILGIKESYDSPIKLNQEFVADMVELKEAYPEQFELLVDKYYDLNFLGFSETGRNPASIKSGIDTLSELGIADYEFLNVMMKQENIEIFSSSIKNVAALCSRQNISLDTFKHQSEKGLIDISEVLKIAHERPDDLEKMFSDILLQGQIVDEYRNLLEELTFPLPEKNPKIDSEKLELIQSRVEAHSIPADVAKEIVKSWGTYSAFRKHMYRDDGWELPTEPIEKSEINRIVNDQLTAFTKQLESLESFAESYGTEVLQEVISTFGIYNFSRHKPEKLVDQLERWKSGDTAKTVVVDARSDWNSFTAKPVEFDEETGDGVFYFEANSGKETARVAVVIGKRERANGRQPNVNRFIIHAHGNNEGMTMGVNRESIELSGYEVAAKSATKISARETNNFRRHLGENFEVILQSCSTAETRLEGKNIAETMSDALDAKVIGSDVTIHGLVIRPDGTVQFKTDKGDGEPVIYT
jgi:hypothetical protein